MKIKKRNLMITLFILFLSSILYTYTQLHPLFDIQIKAHFHEKVISEIMNCVNQIEIPEDFMIREDKNIRVDTNQLNLWIIEVNQMLNENIDDQLDTAMPFGYLTGIAIVQNVGPKISATFYIANRITAQYDIKTTSLGINNVLIELILNIECKGNVYLGFSSNELIVKERIPLALEYVEGDIPQIFPY